MKLSSFFFRSSLLLGVLLSSLLSCRCVSGFDYEIVKAGSLRFTDDKTGIDELSTIFMDDLIEVSVDGIEWNYTGADVTGSEVLTYETRVDGEVQDSGSVDLTDVNRELPTSISVGTIKIGSRGRHTIEVVLTVDESTEATAQGIEVFAAGSSILPLVLVLILSVMSRSVEFSLCSAIFVGACMVTGNIKDGFKTTLDKYILLSLADVDHGYVYIFTLVLSGMVGLMEKSGGMAGFTDAVSRWARSSRSGQLCTYGIGLFIFFDDYANSLLAGKTMRPLTDLLFISREKLSFIVDATSAPIASLTPVSSWVGFEVGLIQTEIDRLVEEKGELTIETSGLAVFMQSIKYRYYPLFMLILVLMTIVTQREYGPMLIAERKTQIYQRKDGGDGGNADGMSEALQNQPRQDAPKLWWNLVTPVLLLIFIIFYLLFKTGNIDGDDQDLIDKLQESDSYSALLWGTMAATLLTIIFYMLQVVDYGRLAVPTPNVIKRMFCGTRNSEEDGDASPSRPRFLLSPGDSLESFLFGMGRVFPALVVLTLAWASGHVMQDVGVDRLFSSWIVGSIPYESLPTLSFLISAFMALATGTSWGTMAILMPLVLKPTYEASNGDETIFYATVAGVLSGSVAGDHVSPISDTTVLSALACDCQLLAHVSTQAPYAVLVMIISIVFGTVPIGRESWPNIVGILLGIIVLGLFAWFLGKPVVDSAGRYDVFTELYLLTQGEESELHQIRKDTIAYATGNAVSMNDMTTRLAKDIDGSNDDTTTMKDIAAKMDANDSPDDTPRDEETPMIAEENMVGEEVQA